VPTQERPVQVKLPRLVATDLDGTLLRSDGTVSERTRRVLADAEAAGIEVVFVTARPPRWLADLEDLVGGHGRAICLGGAAVWDLASGCAIDVCGFDDDAVRGLLADLRGAVPGIALALERADGPVFDPAFTSGRADAHPREDPAWRTGPVEATLAGTKGWPVSKILARSGPALFPQEDFFRGVRGAVGNRAHLAYSGAAGLAELLPPGVTKDAALARWCQRLGIAASDVWAFGDMPNDLPMLSWAGRAVAVANAHSDVLANADVVTARNDDDGVAAYLEAALQEA
jgi:hydroxymethylpyrimidine pyrophosphatase-like HAD family hydrolase